jgi:hypothetical protein
MAEGTEAKGSPSETIVVGARTESFYDLCSARRDFRDRRTRPGHHKNGTNRQPHGNRFRRNLTSAEGFVLSRRKQS